MAITIEQLERERQARLKEAVAGEPVSDGKDEKREKLAPASGKPRPARCAPCLICSSRRNTTTASALHRRAGLLADCPMHCVHRALLHSVLATRAA